VADLLTQISTDLVQGADVFLGALLGGGIAVMVGYFADRRRFKREDQYRDHAERREAYAQFLAAWDRIYDGDLSSEARTELRRTWMTVKLITRSDEVRKHSNFLFSSANIYMLTEDAGERVKLKVNDASKVVHFIAAAREDLDKPKLRGA
jgi:hypothetical protein